MSLNRLTIRNLRNISSIEFNPEQKFNLFYGPNGSGKTSILEAIHYLGFGRSFRGRIHERIIKKGEDALEVFGSTREGTGVGIEKGRGGNTRIRVNSENKKSIAELAEILPIQLIHPESYRILDSGPKYRRQFLDWGVFHVEPVFMSIWRRTDIAIQQRNAALRDINRHQIEIWNREIVLGAEQIDEMRKRYLVLFTPIFNEVYSSLNGEEVALKYQRGWSESQELSEILEKSIQREQMLGYTEHGPHRADLKIYSQNALVEDIFSRGQKKWLICALKFAQGVLLQQQIQKPCIYLMDDLAAELDASRRKKVSDLLDSFDAQIFLTATELDKLGDFVERPLSTVFHVERGGLR
ncbi:MAG: DNA replication/repair protein RecF [Proteobacteria bacterium]|nr:DNA replication/repair protein RecF [Pseudomonadota bacterium]